MTRLVVVGRHGQLARSLQERAGGFPLLNVVLAGRPDLDLERADQLRSKVRALAPDILLNAAAYTAVDQAEQERARAWSCNADAPAILAKVASELDIPMIQISTDYVFAGADERAHREDDETRPTGVYGHSKLAGEKAVRAANPRSAIIRTAWVFSPFGRNFLKTMLALAQTRDEVAVVADQRGSPTNALDLADGLLTLASHWAAGATTGEGETYHLAGSGSGSWADVAEAIFASAARYGMKKARVQRITTTEYPTSAVRPRNSVLDCSKFVRDFGFVMPDWRSSIEAVAARCAAG